MTTSIASVSTEQHSKRYLHNLEKYIADDQKSDVLYEHQKDIFQDTARFLRAGGTRGYIDAPTGTGKTVLFVTLAEAFSYQDDRPPKILVVTPTKDLVRQTQGGTLGDKGFAGFAPELRVGTFYSDTPSSRKSLNDQVTITTYASLNKLAAMAQLARKSDGSTYTMRRNLVNEIYDIIFLDEGHKALGKTTRRVIEGLSKDKVIIGFSATPDYNATRRLDDLLPEMIHRLDLKEAIGMDMLSPVIPIAVPAPKTSAHNFTLGTTGDYETKSLKQLIYDQDRNQMIVNLASDLIAQGNTPIIACIPGDDMFHPHRIADLLSGVMIKTTEGKDRFIKAHAVTGAMTASHRQKLYALLETGDIDALAYIDVLTEGWDSQKANVIVNARPTRSLVAARQRMGRVLRAKVDERPAIVIDIVDPITSTTAPQVSMADIFTVTMLASGAPVGTVSSTFSDTLGKLLSDVTEKYGIVDKVTNLYTQYTVQLQTLPQLVHGKAQIEQKGKVKTFATADRLFKRYNVDSLMLEHFKQKDIATRFVRNKYEAVEAYDEETIHLLIGELPDGPKNGHYASEGETKYISIDDLVGIISHKLNSSHLTYHDVEQAICKVVDYKRGLLFTRRFRAKTHRNVALYTARTLIDYEKIPEIMGCLV